MGAVKNLAKKFEDADKTAAVAISEPGTQFHLRQLPVGGPDGTWSGLVQKSLSDSEIGQAEQTVSNSRPDRMPVSHVAGPPTPSAAVTLRFHPAPSMTARSPRLRSPPPRSATASTAAADRPPSPAASDQRFRAPPSAAPRSLRLNSPPPRSATVSTEVEDRSPSPATSDRRFRVPPRSATASSEESGSLHAPFAGGGSLLYPPRAASPSPSSTHMMGSAERELEVNSTFKTSSKIYDIENSTREQSGTLSRSRSVKELALQFDAAPPPQPAAAVVLRDLQPPTPPPPPPPPPPPASSSGYASSLMSSMNSLSSASCSSPELKVVDRRPILPANGFPDGGWSSIMREMQAQFPKLRCRTSKLWRLDEGQKIVLDAEDISRQSDRTSCPVILRPPRDRGIPGEAEMTARFTMMTELADRLQHRKDGEGEEAGGTLPRARKRTGGHAELSARGVVGSYEDLPVPDAAARPAPATRNTFAISQLLVGRAIASTSQADDSRHTVTASRHVISAVQPTASRKESSSQPTDSRRIATPYQPPATRHLTAASQPTSTRQSTDRSTAGSTDSSSQKDDSRHTATPGQPVAIRHVTTTGQPIATRLKALTAQPVAGQSDFSSQPTDSHHNASPVQPQAARYSSVAGQSTAARQTTPKDQSVDGSTDYFHQPYDPRHAITSGKPAATRQMKTTVQPTATRLVASTGQLPRSHLTATPSQQAGGQPTATCLTTLTGQQLVGRRDSSRQPTDSRDGQQTATGKPQATHHSELTGQPAADHTDPSSHAGREEAARHATAAGHHHTAPTGQSTATVPRPRANLRSASLSARRPVSVAWSTAPASWIAEEGVHAKQWDGSVGSRERGEGASPHRLGGQVSALLEVFGGRPRSARP